MRHILQSEWIKTLNNEQQQLIQASVELYERESAVPQQKLIDYSFVVFTMAKAFEGFLKQRFYELHLIDKNSYEGRRFRIGKALNPDLNERSQDEYWLYDDLSQMCGTEIARELWDTWLICRNQVFHYFPKESNIITLETAGSYLLKMGGAMKALNECQRELELHEQKLNAVYN